MVAKPFENRSVPPLKVRLLDASPRLLSAPICKLPALMRHRLPGAAKGVCAGERKVPVPDLVMVPAPLMTPPNYELRLFEAPTVSMLPVPDVTLPMPPKAPIVSEDVPSAKVPFTVAVAVSAIWSAASKAVIAPDIDLNAAGSDGVDPAVLFKFSVPRSPRSLRCRCSPRLPPKVVTVPAPFSSRCGPRYSRRSQH